VELLPAETEDTAVTAYIEIEMAEARDMEGGAAKPSQAGASALKRPKSSQFSASRSWPSSSPSGVTARR